MWTFCHEKWKMPVSRWKKHWSNQSENQTRLPHKSISSIQKVSIENIKVNKTPMKIIKLVALFVYITLIANTSHAVDSDSAFIDHYTDGDLFTEQNQYDKAISSYSRAYDNATTNEEKIKAAGAKAQLFFTVCNYFPSLIWVGKVLELDRDNAWAINLQKLAKQKQESDEKCSHLVVSETDHAIEEFANNSEKLITEPMIFKAILPCSGSSCREYILAIGLITEDSPQKLEAAINENPWVKDVMFHSLGGNLIAGIEMGRMIRHNNLNTHIERSYSTEVLYKSTKYQYASRDSLAIVEDPVCYSACAYAFLGGRDRTIDSDSSFGIHQFKSDLGISLESTTQLISAVLGEYLVEMGVASELLTVASATASESMTSLDGRALEALNVITTRKYIKQRWEIAVDERNKLVAKVSQPSDTDSEYQHTLLVYKNNDMFVGVAITTVPYPLFKDNSSCLKRLSNDAPPPDQFSVGYDIDLRFGKDEYSYLIEDYFVASDEKSFGLVFNISNEAYRKLREGTQLTLVYFPARICSQHDIFVTFPIENQKRILTAIATH